MYSTMNFSLWPEHPGEGEFNLFSPAVGKGFNSCPRAGGGYTINIVAAGDLAFATQGSAEEADRLRSRITTMLIDQRQQDEMYPEITRDLIERAISKPALQASARARRLLRFIANQTDTAGGLVTIRKETWEAYAWSESLQWNEIRFFANYLKDSHWIEEPNPVNNERLRVTVTVAGYEQLAALESGVDSSQAFVAMWFTSDMKDVYEKGIRPAIAEAGYKPLPINEKEHINRIEDEIINELRQSRFVVADFTHGEDGARGSVYYEAGFAHGMNLQVIFTCREDQLNLLHFDISHYNHVAWSTPDDLRQRLTARILAVLGEGPGLRPSP